MSRLVITSRIKLLLAAVCALLITTPLSAQTLTGLISDENNHPLAGATVSIPALHRATATALDGRFTIGRIPRGTYAVSVSMLGFHPETNIIECEYDTTQLIISLRISPLQIPSLTVSASSQPLTLASSPLAVTVMAGKDLERSRGQSVTATILDAPGVNGYSRGPGTSKPMIRGLMGERVLTLSDGVRQEGQTWDEEYSPEIDAFDFDRIEIVRGPGSVLYGSDALGGVINVIRKELVTHEEGAPTLGALFATNAFSNNSQIAPALSLFGATPDIAYRGHATFRTGGDFNVPGGVVGGGDVQPKGTLSNTAESEFNASATAGIERSWGNLTLDLTHVGREQNLHGDPDSPDSAALPFQQISHEHAHLKGVFPMDEVRLEADLGFQFNNRREFETRVEGDPDAGVAQIDLTLTTLEAALRAHHEFSPSMFGTGGVSFESQHNSTEGLKHLIPAFDQTTMAAFLMENVRMGDFTLLAGGRLDLRSLSVDADDSLHVTAQDHSYTAISGTGGVAWRIARPVTIGLNAGTAWRVPSASELFINGPDEGIVRYKIGDASMIPERSFNLDVNVRVADNAIAAEAAVFRNHIANFIYLRPNGITDTASGFSEYQYTQGDATLTGVEVSMRARVLPWLIINLGGDAVKASLDSSDAPVPVMPASRVRAGIEFVQASLWGIANPFLTFTVRHAFSQDRIGIYEKSTPAYSLFAIGLGGDIALAGTTMHVDLAVENLTDVAYYDHLSRYKDFSLDPGRNIILRLGIPFTIAK